MARPWTVSRDRRGGTLGAGIAAALDTVVARWRTLPLLRPPGAGTGGEPDRLNGEPGARGEPDGLNGEPGGTRGPEGNRGAGPPGHPGGVPRRPPIRWKPARPKWRPGRGSPSAPSERIAREMGARTAIALLAGLTVAALVLAGLTLGLAGRGLALAHRPGAGTSGATASAAGGAVTGTPVTPPGLLISPAPAIAGSLPRRYRTITNPGILLVLGQFRQRFAGMLANQSAAYPSGLYGEPGRADPVTGTTGWVMYLGSNAPADPGPPGATVRRMMTVLAGPAAAARSWRVRAGAKGGAARCVVAIVGQTQASVCGWATNRTVAAVMSPTRDTSVNQLAALMLFMRQDLQPG